MDTLGISRMSPTKIRAEDVGVTAVRGKEAAAAVKIVATTGLEHRTSAAGQIDVAKRLLVVARATDFPRAH